MSRLRADVAVSPPRPYHPPMANPIVVLTTVGTEDEANRMAAELVDRRLAACVNISRGIASVFRWQGEIQRDSEHMLIIKTMEDRFADVSEVICSLHSYECPEVLAMKAQPGDIRFLEWLEESTRPAAADD